MSDAASSTKTTVLLLAGLLLVAANAVVAGHWLSVKQAFVDAEGTGTPSLSISYPGQKTVQRVTNDAKNVKKGVKKTKDVMGYFDDPIAGNGHKPTGTPLTKEAIREIMVGVRGVGGLIGRR